MPRILWALILDSFSRRFARGFHLAYFLPYAVPAVIAALLWAYLYVPENSPIVQLLHDTGIPADFLAPGTVLWFIFVATWTNVMLPLVMFNDPELYPVTLGLYSWQSYKGASNYDIVLTGALLSIIPLVVGFFSLQRHLRSGLAIGGLKG